MLVYTACKENQIKVHKVQMKQPTRRDFILNHEKELNT